MIKEQKDLLFQDLCARLPYGIKVKYFSSKEFFTYTIQSINPIYDQLYLWSKTACFNPVSIRKIKPYLFPLSSMTDEQKKEYYNLCFEEEREEIEFGERVTKVYYHNTIESIDWLNKNYFDYRNLIEKRLAIDCTNLDIY